jgi:hypothetical protein
VAIIKILLSSKIDLLFIHVQIFMTFYFYFFSFVQ